MRVEEPYEELKQFASELTAYNPRKRPPLCRGRSRHEMPAQKRAKIEDNRASNLCCAQMASNLVGMYANSYVCASGA